jgi:hypothetical protein
MCGRKAGSGKGSAIGLGTVVGIQNCALACHNYGHFTAPCMSADYTAAGGCTGYTEAE